VVEKRPYHTLTVEDVIQIITCEALLVVRLVGGVVNVGVDDPMVDGFAHFPGRMIVFDHFIHVETVEGEVDYDFIEFGQDA